MAKKLPYMKLYIGDLKKERTFICLSRPARLLWIEMLFIMHDSEPRGLLQLSTLQLAKAVGITGKEAKSCIEEMELAGTFSRADDGVIYNRRMVRERDISEVKSKAGTKSAEARWADKTTAIKAELEPKTDNTTVTDVKSSVAKLDNRLVTELQKTQQQNPDIDADSEIGSLEEKDNDAETIRNWLEQFTEGRFGRASDAIVLKMLQLLGDSPIECFQDFLIATHSRKVRPDKSYGWFVPLAEDYFGGGHRNGSR